MKNQEESRKERLGKALKRMLEEKCIVREYIEKNGTLKGFKSDTIKFARPF
jgi:hypothetical protein